MRTLSLLALLLSGHALACTQAQIEAAIELVLQANPVILAEVAQLAGAMDEDNRRVRIQRLLWRFQKTLELKPLTRSQSKQLVERWLEHRPIRFSSDRVRQACVRAVVQGLRRGARGHRRHAAGCRQRWRGHPRQHPRQSARGRHPLPGHDPGPGAAVIGFTAMRYVSRGIGQVELLVMSGVGSALFYGLSIFLRRLGR